MTTVENLFSPERIAKNRKSQVQPEEAESLSVGKTMVEKAALLRQLIVRRFPEETVGPFLALLDQFDQLAECWEESGKGFELASALEDLISSMEQLTDALEMEKQAKRSVSKLCFYD